MSLLSVLAFSTITSLPVSQARGGVPRVPVETQPLYWDRLDASGRLVGGRVDLPVPPRPSRADRIPAGCTTLSTSPLLGTSANRIDLVVVGDGYQAGELPGYASQVDGLATYFFNKEPYQSYQSAFLIHRVDVVSVDSGIDNDPTPGVMKDTAMDMGLACNGSWPCIDHAKAYMYAHNAPAVDLVLAIGNSSAVSGYGWFSGIAATAGTGTSHYELVQHELGHSLGRLGDEYDYGDGATYTGPEVAPANVSIRTEPEMAAAGVKWFQWLGENDPAFDGLVSSFEGAYTYQFGVRRPTANSLMRTFFRPFNSPSAENIVIRIYAFVDPIDDSSSTATPYDGTETLYVTPLSRLGPPMAIQWYLDGAPIAGATGPTLDLSTVSLPTCESTISVKVTDTTPMVRNEAAREAFMSETRRFDVRPAFSNYCTGAPNSAGPGGALMLNAGSSSVSANDLVLAVDACPGQKPGLFAWGQGRVQVPLGNGFGCIGSSLKRFRMQRTDAFGYAEKLVDLNALPGGDSVVPGDVRNVQFYYRDPVAGGSNFNLSDALSVRFCP